MSADEHLSEPQFMSVNKLMSSEHWDQSLGSPAYFYAKAKPYIDKLAEDIRQHGVRDPIELQPDGVIDDGHHRVYASFLANRHSVPVATTNHFDDRLDAALRAGGWR